MTHHDRFRRIERARGEEPPESQSADRARIAAVIDASPMSAPDGVARIEVAHGEPAGGGEPLDPSEREAVLHDTDVAAGAPGLAIATAAVEGQPFVRCARCGADSTIHASACENCAAPLDTDEQRAFNERLWDARTEARDREREALARMAEARAEARRNAVSPVLHANAEAPPELVEPGKEEPILLMLLGAAGVKAHRWAVAAGVFLFPVLLIALGGSIVSTIGWALCGLVLASLLPRRVGRWALDVISGRSQS